MGGSMVGRGSDKAVGKVTRSKSSKPWMVGFVAYILFMCFFYDLQLSLIR